MKKIFSLVIVLFTSYFSHAQSVKVSSSAGASIIRESDYQTGFSPVTMLGFEIGEKFGFEYGYSWGLNNSTQQLNNYLYGGSNSYTAGHFTHLVAMYWKTERDEGTCANIGFGISSTNFYKAHNTAVIDRVVLPYIKIGIDHKFNNNWSGTLNSGLGEFTMVTLGFTRKL